MELLDDRSASILGIVLYRTLTILNIKLITSWEDPEYSLYFDDITTVTQACTQLRSLSLQIFDPCTGADEPPELVRDERIRDLTASFQELNTFNLEIDEQITLTIRSLKYLGNSCPQLETCCLPLISDFENLTQSGPVILPQLKRLELYDIRPVPPINTLIGALYHHAPKLEEFQLRDFKKYSRRVIMKLMVLRGLHVDAESSEAEEVWEASDGDTVDGGDFGDRGDSVDEGDEGEEGDEGDEGEVGDTGDEGDEGDEEEFGDEGVP